MKTLYFDCGMGAAGDMLTAALLELTDDVDKSIEELNALQIPGVRFEKEKAVKSGITGTHMRVLVDGEEEDEHMHEHHHHDHDHDHDHEHHHDHDHEHHHHDEEHDHDHEHHHEHDHDHHHHDHDHEHEHSHHHNSMHNIEHIVNDHIMVSDKVKKDVLAVFKLIAEAESTVHDTSIENIHFHEVGTMDAVADITAVCYLLDKLNVDRICASPVHVGKGTVKCAHGILPVPAPATALILKGIPIYSREEIDGELCTPTGAALLKYFVKDYVPMPVLSIDKIGYGMGKKDFAIANCLRAVLGESMENSEDRVVELDFNVDDMTGEELAYATKKILDAGAKEVFTTPVYMKKNRPGNLVTVLCKENNKDEMVRLIFKHTSTVGLRESDKKRYVLDRKISKVETKFGTLRRKDTNGYGVSKSKFEYDDLERVAEEKGISILELKKELGNE